jgi:DNA polymerase-1
MTALPPAGAPDVLYVLDLSAWVHRYWATTQGRAAHGFASFLGRILRERQPAYAAVCADLPFPTFRHDLAPELYKAQRADKEPALLERLRWARELSEDVWGVRVISKRGYEADDLIAALASRAVAQGLRVVIVALDKDLMQLVDDSRVVMWDGREKVWGTSEVHEKFGVYPHQLGDYLALVGDAADNVPGVRSIGPRAARDILEACGDLTTALHQAGAAKGSRGIFESASGWRNALKKHASTARLCRELVALASDAPLPFTVEDCRL